MALNIAVPLAGVGGLSPVSPINLDCWDAVKILASPIGSESSGVSSLDSEEVKMQQCLINHNNHHQLQAELSQQPFTLDLQTTSQENISKNSLQNFANINLNNNNINNALIVNVNNNKNIVKKLQDLKILYNGRDILDLGKNIETNTKLWNLKYTYLPENNNIPMFLANRSQYHRLGANGHIQEYTLYHCDHCDYQFPVMCNTANYMAQTSLNIVLTSNTSASYTTNSFNNNLGSNTNVTNSTSTISSINGGGGNCSVSGTLNSKPQDKPNNNAINNNKNITSPNNRSTKKVQLTKEELNECDFSYTLKKILIDYNNSLNNGMQNFPVKCNNNNINNSNNNNNNPANNQLPSIFSHSVAAVAAAAALSPQLSSQATSPSCCSSSGYSSNGSTHSLFNGNNGIKYPVAAMAPICNNNNINNMNNVQNNFNKNPVMPFQQQQAKMNYNKSPTAGINNNTNNNNSFYSLLNSLNNINGNNNNNNNNGNCNNNYGNNFWNNSNNNNNITNGLSYGANNNLTNQMNTHNPNLLNNSANNQNFARMYKYF